MQVAIQVDHTQIRDDVHDIFASLTHDQKQAIARDILKGWLDLPPHVEQEMREVRALQIADERNAGDEWWRRLSTAEKKGNYRYTEILKSLPVSGRAAFASEVTKQVFEWLRVEVGIRLGSDPEFKRMADEVMKTVKDQYPKMVHDAMMAYMTTQMTTMASAVQQSLAMLPEMGNALNDLNNRLLQAGH